MNNRSDSSTNANEQAMKDLGQMSPEEARKFVINSITPECRELAENFFSCIEDQFKSLGAHEVTDIQAIERNLNQTIIPACSAKYDLEACIKKYDQGKL
jgi:hypothetical protein